jgi:hypothetical protein
MPPADKGRKKPRHRGAQARANTDLQAHIESLGLRTPEEYRAWCRQNGFTGALNKDWSERRKERLAAKKHEADSKPDPGLQRHLAALGLETAPEYQAWCRKRGVSDALRKSADQRKRELRLHDETRALEALKNARRMTRTPRETIGAIYRREIGGEELKGDLFHAIDVAFRSAVGKDGAREALYTLLLVAEERSDLLSLRPAHPRFGESPFNTFVHGLLGLARRHRNWVREPEPWEPSSHNPRRQFGSLARRLLARYPVPAFMDAAWFEGGRDAAAHQEWFERIGRGENLRTAALPLAYTRMMAHEFPSAPPDLTIPEALRWGQVRGMGGGEGLARAALGTFLAELTPEEPFWATVLLFFAQNPMLDPDQVGPIVDYIRDVKFTPVERRGEDGRVETAPPPFPGFSMKGRTVPALLERVEAWHRELAKEARAPAQAWKPSGLNGYSADEAEGEDVCRWTVTELLSAEELREEGRAMSHCVRSYAANCAKGKVSVWSVRREDPATGVRKRALTVAVKNDTRIITEARGKQNVSPEGKGANGRARSLGGGMKELLHGGREAMQRWARREGLSLYRKA